MASEEGQQHPLGIYFVVWGLLFLFSGFSYGTDFLPAGYLRWAAILLLMFLKAGFIVAIFMHMAWERIALILAILGPPALLIFLIGFMAVEGDYTLKTRDEYFSAPPAPAGAVHEAGEAHGD